MMVSRVVAILYLEPVAGGRRAIHAGRRQPLFQCAMRQWVGGVPGWNSGAGHVAVNIGSGLDTTGRVPGRLHSGTPTKLGGALSWSDSGTS
jgi:hypothetical protein